MPFWSGDLLDEFAGFQIDHVETAVGHVGHEQPLMFPIDGQMIEPASRSREGDGFDQLQRRRVRGRHAACPNKYD
jgi:hypothetical protein